MRDTPISLRVATTAVFASAALHIGAVATAGFAQPALILLGVSSFYVLLGLGLLRRLGWVTYLTFICMLIGAKGALIEIGRETYADYWIIGIALADGLAAAALFVALWQSSPTQQVA